MRLPSAIPFLLGLPLFAQEVAVDPVVRFSRQLPRAEFLYVVSDGRGDFFALGRSNDPTLSGFTQRCSGEAEWRLMLCA